MKPRLLLLISIFMIINACLAGVPKVLMIKRQLASNDGSVINGDTTIAICIYDVGCSGDDCPDACTGNPIVCDTQVVTVSGGYFYFKLDLSSVDDSYLSDTLYLMVSVKNGGSYEDLCPRETLYATHACALSSHIADKSYNSDSLGGHPPDYYLDNTIDTFIAYWDSIRNIPEGFADGVDNEGVKGEGKIYLVAYWENESTLTYDNSLYWDAVNNRLKIGPMEGVIPSGMLHIDGNGATGVDEIYIENPGDNIFINFIADGDKEAGIKFSGSFTLARLASTHDLRLLRIYNSTYEPSLYIKNSNGYVGIGTDTPSAKFDVNGAAEINGQLDMTSHKIINLTDPTNSQDAATKAYVDAQASNDDLSDNVLNDLSDVNVTPSDGQVLKYNSSSGKWEAAVDDTGHYEPKDTFIAYWDSIRNIPNDIADGDNFDTLKASWSYIKDIPSGFADGVDDTGHFEPKDTFIAYWDSIRNIPNDIADGDDIDTIKADWNNIKNMPSDFADGVDDTGKTIGIKDTMIAYWDSLRNVPSDLANGDDVDTFIAHWDSVRGKPQLYWINLYIKLDGDTIIDTVYNQDTVKSKAVDSLNYRVVIANHLHGGSNHWKVESIVASTTIDVSTTVYLCDASDEAITLTLTEPSENKDRLLVIKKLDNSANKVTIDAGSSTIDGSQTYNLNSQHQSIILICDGTKWWIIADK